MTGLEYEKLVAKYLRRHGYYGVSVTKASGDYGVDVIAHKGSHRYAVQCKYYSDDVGLEAVQEAVAGKAMYNCDRAMVVTNSAFTEAAKKLAKHNTVVLLEGITSTGFRFRFKYLLWLLAGAYAFIATAALSAAFDSIKQQPFWTAVCNVVTFVPVVTAPFWLWPLTVLIKNKIKKRSATKPISPVTKTATENFVPVTMNTAQKIMIKASAEKLQKIISKVDTNSDLSEISILAELDTVTTSKFQRTLKIGYARAARVIDYLLENGYIKLKDSNTPFIYEWTENAK